MLEKIVTPFCYWGVIYVSVHCLSVSDCTPFWISPPKEWSPGAPEIALTPIKL